MLEIDGNGAAGEAIWSGCAGSATESCRNRLAQMKLSAKGGPSGSRRQEVPLNVFAAFAAQSIVDQRDHRR